MGIDVHYPIQMKEVFAMVRIQRRAALLFAVFISMGVFFSDTSTAAADGASSDRDATSSALLRRSVYDTGRWSLGLDGNFSMTTSNVELMDDGGAQATDSTMFMRLDPWVTIGVIERLHVGLAIGVVSRRLAQETVDPTTDTAMVFQPMGQYFFPLSRRLAIYTQLATGAYIGRSQRAVPTDPDEPDRMVTENTRTRGFILTVGTGINYRLTEGFQLRFGLAFNGIWGREAIESIDESLAASTTNLQTSAGIRYTF
jgi:hypothetical protein